MGWSVPREEATSSPHCTRCTSPPSACQGVFRVVLYTPILLRATPATGRWSWPTQTRFGKIPCHTLSVQFLRSEIPLVIMIPEKLSCSATKQCVNLYYTRKALGTYQGGTLSETYAVRLDDVVPVPNLGPDQGWVGMTVQFLIEQANAGAEHMVFGRARFAPGPSEHQWHRHPNAEEFALIVQGEGVALDGDNEVPVKAGDVVFHRKGSWHGFRNTSETDEAVMIWGWAGAASKADAGYELRHPPQKH